MEFNAVDNKRREYKLEVIWDNAVYMRESELSHLPGLYYLVSTIWSHEKDMQRKRILGNQL